MWSGASYLQFRGHRRALQGTNVTKTEMTPGLLFSSFTFLFCFLCYLPVHHALASSRRLQLGLCLLASYAFYGYWDPRFLVLIVISTAIDYNVALALAASEDESRRKRLLWLSLCGNLGLLAVFKYFDFFQQSLAQALGGLGLSYHPLLLQVVLPVGISFYTFQTLGYTIDVFRRRSEPCRDPLLFALFVAYFPQLVAGPIERASALLPKLHRPEPFRWGLLSSGLTLVIIGLFKKCVLGDLAGYYLADPAFASPSSGLHLMVGVLAFTVQIYGDFSGYTDIARGVSRCLGVELSKNFLAPYFAANITDFWRRWHITLSSWFRDYLYIPLGGNRNGPQRTYLNLSLTMLLCGLWHGAAATYLLWGAYHGGLLLTHRRFTNRGPASEFWLSRLSSQVLCFGLVCYGWMIFRLESADQLVWYTMVLLTPWEGVWDSAQLLQWLGTLLPFALGTAFFHRLEVAGKEFEELYPPALVGALLGLMVGAILSLGSLAEPLPFLYFQF